MAPFPCGNKWVKDNISVQTKQRVGRLQAEQLPTGWPCARYHYPTETPTVYTQLNVASTGKYPANSDRNLHHNIKGNSRLVLLQKQKCQSMQRRHQILIKRTAIGSWNLCVIRKGNGERTLKPQTWEIDGQLNIGLF